MNRPRPKFLTVAVLSLMLITSSLSPATSAAIIDTSTVLRSEQGAAQLSQVTAELNRSEVLARLVELGVRPADVEARIALLTDEELATLAERIDELPAGGDALGVIGAVFLVLLILELVGIIDIFKSVPAKR